MSEMNFWNRYRSRDRPKGGGPPLRSGVEPAVSREWERPGAVAGHVELSGAVGAKQVHEVHAGGSATDGCSAATLGLSLAEAKAILAGLQRHLVQAQAEEHCQVRRRCPRCGGQRPLKDRRPRQPGAVFGPGEPRAPWVV